MFAEGELTFDTLKETLEQKDVENAKEHTDKLTELENKVEEQRKEIMALVRCYLFFILCAVCADG